MGDKNPLPSSGKTLRLTESATLPPIAATQPGFTSTTISQWPAPRLRLSRVVPLPAARGAYKVADLGRPLGRPVGDEGGTRPARPLDQPLDVDRVARVRAEEIARHARTGDVPGDEGGRPGHVVEAAALGMADAGPVVVDALGRFALLDAQLLGARRLVGGIDDDLAAEAGPFADRQQHHRDLGAGRRRRRLGFPRRGGAGAERRQVGGALHGGRRRGLRRRRAARPSAGEGQGRA